MSTIVSTLGGLTGMAQPFSAWQERGTDYTAMYVGGMCNATALTTGIPTVDAFYALPFVAPAGGWLDQITFRVTTGAVGSKARAGIYSNAIRTSPMYPDRLIVDGGEKTTTANNTSHTTTINVHVEPNKLYWLTLLVGAAAPTMRSLALAACYPIMGLSSVLATTPQVGWFATQAYGALPSTFPIDYAAFLTAVPIPAIGVRFVR